MRYFARITKQNCHSYLVEFSELKGCLSSGKTLKQAKKNAYEALNGWLASCCDRNLNIPEPKIKRGKNDHPIDVDLNTSFAIALRKIRKKRKLSQSQVAKKLGITQQAYSKFENPSKANPSLSTLKKISRILDMGFHLESAA